LPVRVGSAWAALAVSLALAAGAPLGWALTRPAADAGVVPSAPAVHAAGADAVDGTAGETREPPTAARDRATTGASRTPDHLPGLRTPPKPAAARTSDLVPASTDRPPPPRPATRSARIGDLQPATTPAPARLEIPDLGVAAPVDPVGVTPDGAMALPTDVNRVGWYEHGPHPGSAGAAVLAAHVDSRTQGRGVLFDLRRLEVGATILVTDDDGHSQHFDVVARRTYDKRALPVDELFSRAGPPGLVLVTCGGDFDPASGSYEANVVVHAVPADTPAR
jgi:sortase (surface protein transpeptidase)